MPIGRGAAVLTGVMALALVVLASPTVSANGGWSPPDRALGLVRAHHPHGYLDYQDPSELCPACRHDATQRYPYNNWSSAPEYNVGVDGRDRILVASARRHHLVLLRYTHRGVHRTARYTTDYGRGWRYGGAYFAPDGFLYLLLGRNNPHERDRRVVLKIRKLDGQLHRLGTAKYRSGQAPGGVYRPFSFSSGSLSQAGDRVVVAYGREVYADSNGVHHQVGDAVVVRTTAMTAKHFAAPSASHQFNEVARTPGDGNAYVVEHGDAYPRSIYLGKKPLGKGSATGFALTDITGPTGDNFTGTTVNGFDIAAGRAIAVGVSIPHRHAVAGVSGFGVGMMPNAYLISSGLTSGSARYQWLTSFNPETTHAIVGQPSLIALADGRYVVLYNVSKGRRLAFTDYYRRKNSTHYVLVGSQGKILARHSWSGKQYFPLSHPTRVGNRVLWVALFRDRTSSGTLRGGAYLAGLDVSDPSAPTLLKR